jgi:hypothetical protein
VTDPTKTGFDFPAFRTALVAKDVSTWLTFYAEDAKWVEYRHDAPPRAPHRMRGHAQIGSVLVGVAAADIDLAVADAVIGPGRVAFAVTGSTPAGDVSTSTPSFTCAAPASLAGSMSRPGTQRSSDGIVRNPPPPVVNEPSSRLQITTIPLPGHAPEV